MEELLCESWKDQLEIPVQKLAKKISGGYPVMIPGNVSRVIPEDFNILYEFIEVPLEKPMEEFMDEFLGEYV